VPVDFLKNLPEVGDIIKEWDGKTIEIPGIRLATVIVSPEKVIFLGNIRKKPK
jgi:hypothetical protein